MRTLRFVPVLGLLGSIACASTVSSNALRPTGHPMLGSKVLTMRELSTITSARDMYDVVASLNPQLLMNRGQVVSVALNGVLSGTVETLRFLAPGTVQEVRLIEGPDATMFFGSRHTGSVLMVTTRRR